MIWLAALKAARVAIGLITGACKVADIGRDIVRDVGAAVRPPEDDGVPLTWETVEHQRQQAASAAHAFPPSSDMPTQPAVPKQMPGRKRRTDN